MKQRLPADQFLDRIRAPSHSDTILPTTATRSAHERAAAILSTCAGLHVGETGAGQDQARSDIEFFPELDADMDAFAEEWQGVLGRLIAFADAHHGHETVFVDDAGEFYSYAHPNGILVPIGRDFAEAMACLLLGKRRGAPISEG